MVFLLLPPMVTLLTYSIDAATTSDRLTPLFTVLIPLLYVQVVNKE